jgi:hypothetical protein
MATLTVTLDPAVLEAAKREAQDRNTSIEQMVSDYLCGLAKTPPTDEQIEALIRLMHEGPLGTIDRPLTREEIYAERTWPRS